MSDDKYQALGDGDLTPEQLDGMEMWERDVMLDERHRAVGAMLVRRAVAEIRRHRATKAASAARVRSVVREALRAGEMASALERLDGALDRIADRVAAQLGPVGLTEGERLALVLVASDRGFRAERPAAASALDRLLGGRDVG